MIDPAKAQLMRSEQVLYEQERMYWASVSEGAAEDFDRRNAPPEPAPPIRRLSAEERGF